MMSHLSWLHSVSSLKEVITIVSPYNSALHDSQGAKTCEQIDVAQYCWYNFVMTLKTDQVGNNCNAMLVTFDK